MAFLRVPSGPDPLQGLRGNGVWLRQPVSADYAAWAQLRQASRDHLTPFEPQWSGDELTRAAFRWRIRHSQRDMRDDRGYAFFIFRQSDSALLGGVTLSNVRRGVTQCGSLGYWIGAPYAGRGFMTHALRTLLLFVFDELRLHRVEAACLPENAASIRVLEKAGFAREGVARRYLKINGEWRDHVLFALLEDDERP
ncbi:MAG: GNAT family protein [Pseudomonadota bacterium]